MALRVRERRWLAVATVGSGLLKGAARSRASCAKATRSGSQAASRRGFKAPSAALRAKEVRQRLYRAGQGRTGGRVSGARLTEG